MADPDINLHIAREALGEIGNDVEDGTIPELAARLQQAELIRDRAKVMCEQLNLVLTDRMEQDNVQIPGIGWLVRRPRKPSNAGSNWKGAREAAKAEIVFKLARDRATGEIRPDWKSVAEDTIALYERVMSVGGPKRPFEDELNLRMEDYVITTPTGYFVAIEPEEGT